MKGLRQRVTLLFLAATIGPLLLTLWVAQSLLDKSVRYSGIEQVDELSQSLEATARQLYQRERDALRSHAGSGAAPDLSFIAEDRRSWPAEVEEFHQSGEASRFLVPPPGNRLLLLQRRGEGVAQFERTLGNARLETARRQYTAARAWLTKAQSRDLPRGLFSAFVLLAVVPWVAALLLLIVAANRAAALAQRNYQALSDELNKSRERLLFLARLESWQTLGRKMAHEVKNSLTPIRLTMEELAARHERPDSFERQAAKIIVDEVCSLERRVRAFSQLASEPPVIPRPLVAAELIAERVQLLERGYPGVHFNTGAVEPAVRLLADEDLAKAILTNLLENACQAAGPGGRVSISAAAGLGGGAAIEIHDSGAGFEPGREESLFEPSISFKKGGMGIGLSIARKSAVLCGGDIVLVKGQLGGAGFRVELPAPGPEVQSSGLAPAVKVTACPST